MNYTVAVTAHYRRDCAPCRESAQALSASALADPQVTSFQLRAVSKCSHDAGGDTPRGPLPGQQRLTLADLPPSDTNGMNGFDPEGRP